MAGPLHRRRPTTDADGVPREFSRDAIDHARLILLRFRKGIINQCHWRKRIQPWALPARTLVSFTSSVTALTSSTPTYAPSTSLTSRLAASSFTPCSKNGGWSLHDLPHGHPLCVRPPRRLHHFFSHLNVRPPSPWRPFRTQHRCCIFIRQR